MLHKSLLMTGFEPRISCVGNDRSTNWATTNHCPTSIYFSINRLFDVIGRYYQRILFKFNKYLRLVSKLKFATEPKILWNDGWRQRLLRFRLRLPRAIENILQSKLYHCALNQDRNFSITVEIQPHIEESTADCVL